jgi:hypothetical protein
MPQGSGGGSEHYSCGAVICCGQRFTDCNFDGGDCFFIRVKNPEVRKRLDQVADTSRILVADCRGRYALYEPGSGRRSVRDSVFVNDHILR